MRKQEVFTQRESNEKRMKLKHIKVPEKAKQKETLKYPEGSTRQRSNEVSTRTQSYNEKVKRKC